MTRRRVVLAVVAVLLVVAVLRLPHWSARLLERELTEHFRRTVTVESVHWRLLPLEAEVRGLRIAGPRPDSLPFAEVPLLTVVPAVRPMWEGRLSLWRLRLQNPQIRANTYVNGGDDIPQLARAAGPQGGVDIRRLVIEGGTLTLDDQRIPLDLDLPQLRARLATRGDGELAGDVAFGPGPVRFGDAPPLQLQADARLAFARGVLTIESGRVRGQGADLGFSGRVDVTRRLQARLTLSGAVPLELADTHVLRSGLGLAGAARYQGSAQVQDGRLTLAGRIDGEGGAFDGLSIPRFAGHLTWDASGLRLRGLELSAMGGSATLDVVVPRADGRASVDGAVKGVDAEALARYVLDAGPLALGASATGPVALSWPRGRPRLLSGSADLQLAERSQPGRTPLSGALLWTAVDGVQTLKRTTLHTPDVQVAVEGRIGVSRDVTLAVDAQTTSLEQAEALSLRLRRAFGVPQPATFGVSGAGRFRGTWRGTLDAPVFEGRFEGTGVSYAGVEWGSVDWTGVADALETRSQPLVLRRGDGELRLEGSIRAGRTPGATLLDLRATARAWPAEELQRAAQVDAGVTGLVDGEATLAGRRDALSGRVRWTMAQARRGAQTVEDLAVDVVLQPEGIDIRSARARAGGGTLEVSGPVARDGGWDLRATIADVDLGALLPELGQGVRWGGRVAGTARLTGSRASPAGEARFTSPRVFLGDEGVGALDLGLSGSGDGQVTISGGLRSARVDLQAQGRIAATAPHLGRLTLRARATSLDPFVRLFVPALPESVRVVASGETELSGDFAAPLALHAATVLPQLEIGLPDYPIRNAAPVKVELADGRVRLLDLHVEGEGTDLRIGGDVSILGARPLELEVRGDADLRALGAVTRRLRGQGAARLAMTITGPALEPRVDGTLEVTRGGIRVRGFPHGLDALTGTVRFSERAARFADVTGTLGGGEVTLEGQAGYTLGRLASFDVSVTGRRMALRYPEGLRSVVDAELRLFGDAARQWAAGRVHVHQAVWTRRYDVATELLGTRAAWEQRASLQEGVHLDIAVRAPGTLRVDNNLASLEARADLALQGTSLNPVVLGRAEVERGRVYFQGNTYVIRRGTIDFVNPQRIDPLFDIEAETRLRSYRVTLKVNGTLDRVYPGLTSDPPLNAVQIVSLLAGGDESTVASLATAGASQGASGANLAATGAATLAAGRISEQVGLERGAERLLGLNRFSIDPSLVKGGVQNPTARLTLGKRVTPDLNVLYSVDLRGTDERLLSVEYTLSDRLSVLMTRAEPGGFGFDLRLRQSR